MNATHWKTQITYFLKNNEQKHCLEKFCFEKTEFKSPRNFLYNSFSYKKYQSDKARCLKLS